MDLSAGGERIQTTSEHPFAVEGKGWVKAGLLHPGDQVATQTGHLATLKHVEVRNETHLVYNLEVEGTHKYFVGNYSLLVHNGEEDYVPQPRPGQLLSQELKTNGFFDRWDAPPWDTWIWYGELGHIINVPANKAIEVILVSWIPPVFLELAQAGINAHPFSAINWIEEAFT